MVDLWLCVSFQLALRAGNEKEEGETADTVGCCSLRVEHIKLHSKLDGQEHVVEFDFLGKDSIRYYNKVSVEKPVSGRDGHHGQYGDVAQGSLGGLAHLIVISPKSESENCFDPIIDSMCKRQSSSTLMIL